MKVLMTGPGKGHNIQRFLKYFQKSEEHSMDYYHYNAATHYDLKSYSNVDFIGTFQAFKLIAAIRRAELIWVHNWTPWPLLWLIQKFRSKNSVLNFNFWSEKLIRDVLGGENSKSNFYKRFWLSCDVLQTTWFSTKRWVDKLGHPNSKMMRWGLEDEYFQPVDESKLSDFTTEFVASLPTEKFKFFVPKSIGFPNRHDQMVRAAHALKLQGHLNFVIYFWKGNHVASQTEQKILKLIEELQVADLIKLVNHPFLENNEMKYIWQHMDAGLQLCDQDQLSTAFTEPLLFGKPLIASDIYSYRKFNEYFDTKIPLVEHLFLGKIGKGMRSLMNDGPEKKEKQERKRVIAENFKFQNNITKIMVYFEDLKNMG